MNGVAYFSAYGSAGYELWPAADLFCPNGNATDPELNAMAGQGALNAVRGTFAENLLVRVARVIHPALECGQDPSGIMDRDHWQRHGVELPLSG